MENEEIVTNPTWIDEGGQRVLDILNQPFVIAIIVTLIICIFVVIVLKSTSFGKKSIKRQDDKINAQDEVIGKATKDLDNKAEKIETNNGIFKEKLLDEFKNFLTEEKGFKDLTINALGEINNVRVQKLLEDYKHGKEQERKDSTTTSE